MTLGSNYTYTYKKIRNAVTFLANTITLCIKRTRGIRLLCQYAGVKRSFREISKAIRTNVSRVVARRRKNRPHHCWGMLAANCHAALRPRRACGAEKSRKIISQIGEIISSNFVRTSSWCIQSMRTHAETTFWASETHFLST